MCRTCSTAWPGVCGRLANSGRAGIRGARVRSAGRAARRSAAFLAVLTPILAALNGVGGYLVFSRAADSAVSHVDAVVVLGGEHDGRERYGLAQAQQGLASTVVLSDPYPATDPVMSRMCSGSHGAVEVLCPRPDPATTRGEALMTRRLAVARHWKSVMLISWGYHLPRARLLFCQCLCASGVSIATKAVPRHYVLPLWYWEYIYLYQFAGIAKALAIGHC